MRTMELRAVLRPRAAAGYSGITQEQTVQEMAFTEALTPRTEQECGARVFRGMVSSAKHRVWIAAACMEKTPLWLNNRRLNAEVSTS